MARLFLLDANSNITRMDYSKDAYEEYRDNELSTAIRAERDPYIKAFEFLRSVYELIDHNPRVAYFNGQRLVTARLDDESYYTELIFLIEHYYGIPYIEIE